MKFAIPGTVSLLALAGCNQGPAEVADSAEARDLSTLELLPDHVTRRILADSFEASAQQLMSENKVAQGTLDIARRWPAGASLRVCFQSGSTAVRKRIVEAASGWERIGANVGFDFGDRNNPRLCSTNEFNQIRVGFGQPGYWSLVGQDSIIKAPQYKQSLNLVRFDITPPAEPDFTRLVLHEFGHALGFNHEHQHDTQSCEAEFNWPQVYAHFKPVWSKPTVDHNMRSRRYLESNIRTDFDPKSVMLYSFPANFYLKGAASRCFSATNYRLSDGDIRTARLAYPMQGGAGVPGAARPLTATAALAAAAPSLPADVREAFTERLAVLRADLATKAQILGAGDHKFTDVDIRSCSADDASIKYTDDVARFVIGQPRYGQIRYAGLYSGPKLDARISVLADLSHPEATDGKRLADALSDVFPNQVKLVGKPQPVDRWLLTVVACDRDT